MKHLKTLIVFVVAFTTMAFAPLDKVADNDRVPVDLRRTTLVVQDIDASLALYRDLIGMKVIYDNVIIRPDGASDADATYKSRLVFLRANDTKIGILGLLQYIIPNKAPNTPHKPFTPGTSVLLFNTPNVKDIIEGAKGLDGVKVLAEPRTVQYPNYKGDGKIDVLMSVIQDADGFILEVNQLLSELDNN